MHPTSAVPAPEAASVQPTAISWRINAERLMLLGWGRAILLQLAHPLIAAGVYDHSSFRANALTAAARLHATVGAMLSLTFGTDAQREHALNGIRTIHRRVNGRLTEEVGPFRAGTPYSAEDPDLVLWVHLTLLESIPLVYQLLVAPLTDRERDEYCREAAWVAIALGARPAEVPRSWAETREHLDRIYASRIVTVGPQARTLGRLVVSPRIAWLFPPAAVANRLLTVGLLPPHIRAQYGFRWSPLREHALRFVVLTVRGIRRVLPDALALWPAARP